MELGIGASTRARPLEKKVILLTRAIRYAAFLEQ